MKKIIMKNKCLCWASNFKNVFFGRTMLKMYFLREQLILKRGSKNAPEDSDEKYINSIIFKQPKKKVLILTCYVQSVKMYI